MSSLPEWMNRFLFIAHRGASAYEPENTIKAFRRALEMGADAIEMDVRITSDGVPVVIHDETLDRVAGANLRVRDLTLSELRKHLVFGSEPIPTLTEVLDEFGGRIPLFIEIKDVEATEKVIQEIASRGLQRDVAIISFKPEALAIARNALKDLVTGIITSRRIASAREVIKLGVQAFLPRYDAITPRIVKEMHAHGVRVYVWTVNDPSLAVKLIGYGVDGIATDRPDLKRSVGKQQTLLKYLKP